MNHNAGITWSLASHTHMRIVPLPRALGGLVKQSSLDVFLFLLLLSYDEKRLNTWRRNPDFQIK